MVSGLTVMIALAGLFLTGYAVFTGIAIGTIAVVGIAVLGSLTVLPALLSWLGPRADRGRIPFLGRRRDRGPPVPGVGRRWSAGWCRRPLLWGGAAAIALLALAAPALGMRLGEPGRSTLPGQVPGACRPSDRIQRRSRRAPSPAEVVVTGQRPRPARAVRPRSPRCRPGRGARRPDPRAGHRHPGRPAAAALIVSVPLAGNGDGRRVRSAPCSTLRDRVLPATLGTVRGISYAVAGDTAEQLRRHRGAARRARRWCWPFVAVLAFVLLLVAFRSVAIPLVSIALNLLSVGAAYGLITLIFQDGRLQGLLGYTSFGAIIPWVPLFMFVLLFGLSMDYHVFILSRIRELRSARRQHPGRDRRRHRQQRRGGDQRGGHHGGGVLHLGHAAASSTRRCSAWAWPPRC